VSFDAPPVVIVSGQEVYLRRRQIRKAVVAANNDGWRVEYLRGEDRAQLSRVLASGSVLFKGRTLAVITNPDKLDPKTIIKHGERKKAKVTLVLHCEGDVKKRGNLAKIVEGIPKKHHIVFKSPAQYKRDDFCIGHLVKDAREVYGLRLQEKTAKALVNAAGTNLGILAFELQKAAMFAKADGAEELTPGHLSKTLSRLTEAGAIPVVDALAARDEARLVRSMSSVRKTHTGDPTLKVCALLSRNVIQWLHAVCLVSQNAGEQEIAQRIGLHPWICKTKVVPPAKNWGLGNLKGLLTALAKIERAVKSGHVAPWVELETTLIQAIRKSRSK
jgi:DNA polymerase III delta subunit